MYTHIHYDALNEGFNPTALENIKIYKCSKHLISTDCAYIYDNWLVVVLNNQKVLKLNPTTSLHYDKNSYLIASSMVHFEYETFASPESPFVSLLINLDYSLMSSLIDIFSRFRKTPNIPKSNQGIFTGTITTDMQNTIQRLINICSNTQDATILGSSILYELYYKILQQDNASFLFNLFDKTSNEAKISKILKVLHSSYHDAHLDINRLASKEGFSTSSFHTHFRKVTLQTPLQYLKKVRLNKAKELLEYQNARVGMVAKKVGYKDAFHFSRDFKNYFLYPPKDHIKPT